jgi:dihydroorotate dehydrogenase
VLALNPDAYRLLLRPLLFRLPPETAQRTAELALGRERVWRWLAPVLRVSDPRLPVDLCGLKLDNPVGLAAGYDKDCIFLPSMAALGFGYVTGGTVTESPRPGNPRPRVIRYVKERSLINALGFPSHGLEVVARYLERSRYRGVETPTIISVSGVTPGEILRCHERLEPLCDGIEVNISSPNTAGLRVFQEADGLDDLLGQLEGQRNKPLFVKLPPYEPDDSRAQAAPDREADEPQSPAVLTAEQVLALARVCVRRGVDALTVANSRPTRDPRLSTGVGGLSGKMVFPDTLRMVAEVRSEVGAAIAINACGGIFSGEDAWRALQAGATTVQLLTGLIYRGPGIVKRINHELLASMAREQMIPSPKSGRGLG